MKMVKSPTNEDQLEKKEDRDNPALSAEPNLTGDWLNVFVLILLYTIQYLPHGFIISLPIIFQSKKMVTYQEQVNNITQYETQNEFDIRNFERT